VGQITGYGINPDGLPRAYLLSPPPLVMLANLVQSFQLPEGITKKLDGKVIAAESVDPGSGAYCADLTEFESEVQSLSGKKLTTAQANQLIARADEFKQSANCF